MSRATIVDTHLEEENASNIENEVQETQEAEAEQSADVVEQTQDAVETDTDDDIPEQYRGKSLKEVVQMHQEVEKVMSRHSNEVGELRKIVDEYITAQTPSPAPGGWRRRERSRRRCRGGRRRGGSGPATCDPQA